MYAILEDGGKQYRVSQGDVIDIEGREVPEGQDTLELDSILLLKDDHGTTVGTPTVPGAKVSAKVNALVKGAKVKIFKLRRRKNSSTQQGHRQGYLRVTITEIHSGS